jgi:hypothetical protein
MLRACYSLLLRLHPAPFRQSYEKEMRAIFDDLAVRESVLGLFTDIVVSLFRQWVLRPEFRRTQRIEPTPVPFGGAPLLASLDSYTLRPHAMLMGCLLSLVFFSAVVTASIRPGKPAYNLFRLGEETEDPWRAAASFYFKSILVARALDMDGDFVISASEIDAAPWALRRLDLNHDGKLSPEECGFALGRRSQDGDAQKRFMLAHPLLAALDADHDSEISAAEISNSSRSLLTLDSDGDGFLIPTEVMPHDAGK